uniref:Uncharacterized protein n=1 Tax=Timema poppense TaxID=170557 RepID=A0A7R9H765_TIMPO|nr:unnamed protein product [Timema poppensis]
MSRISPSAPGIIYFLPPLHSPSQRAGGVAQRIRTLDKGKVPKNRFSKKYLSSHYAHTIHEAQGKHPQGGCKMMTPVVNHKFYPGRRYYCSTIQLAMKERQSCRWYTGIRMLTSRHQKTRSDESDALVHVTTCKDFKTTLRQQKYETQNTSQDQLIIVKLLPLLLESSHRAESTGSIAAFAYPVQKIWSVVNEYSELVKVILEEVHQHNQVERMRSNTVLPRTKFTRPWITLALLQLRMFVLETRRRREDDRKYHVRQVMKNHVVSELIVPSANFESDVKQQHVPIEESRDALIGPKRLCKRANHNVQRSTIQTSSVRDLSTYQFETANSPFPVYVTWARAKLTATNPIPGVRDWMGVLSRQPTHQSQFNS